MIVTDRENGDNMEERGKKVIAKVHGKKRINSKKELSQLTIKVQT